MPTTAVSCASCAHPADQHAGLAGCLAETGPGAYCPCSFSADTIRAHAREEANATPVAVIPGIVQGRALRDEGAAAAGTTSPTAEAWRSAALEAVDVLAAAGQEFSADDLVERVGMPPVANMLGGVFLTARHRGTIRAYGFTQAQRPASHARVQRTWMGA